MVKKYIILFTFLLPVMLLHAQTQHWDVGYGNHIKESVKTEGNDTARIDLLFTLVNYYLDRNIVTDNKKNLDSALTVAQKALTLSMQIGDGNRKNESTRLMGSVYLVAGDSVASHKCIEQVLNYFKSRQQYPQMVNACIKYARAGNRASFHNLSIQFYERALSIATTHHLGDNEIQIKSFLVFEKGAMGQMEAAMTDAFKIVNQYKKSGRSLGMVYCLIATTYRYRGDLKTALNYGLASVHDVELHHDSLVENGAYAELALIYDVLGETEKSVFFYRKTLAARLKKPRKEEFIYRTLGFIAKDLIKLGRAKEALKEVQEFQKAHPPQSASGEAFCYQNLAYCYEALKDYTRAESYYLNLLKSPVAKVSDEIGTLAYYDVINFYLLQNRHKLAQYYALKVGSRNTSLDNIRNYENLCYKIDSALGNYKSALYHYGKSQQAKDSLLNQSKIHEISELQLKYETVQKEKDISLLKKDSQLQRDRATQANHIRNITFACIGLLSLVLVFLYKLLVDNKQKADEIDQKNASLNRLIAEKDGFIDEKEWLLKEIHHRVKNNLQIVIGLLQRQSSYIDNEVALNAIQNSENRMYAIALIHQKLYLSESFDRINMQEYIDDLITHVKDCTDTGGQVIFDKNLDRIYLNVSQAVPLGLILNEATTNAIKHACPANSAAKIHIWFRQTPDHYNQLIVKDNGNGFDKDFDFTAIQSMGINLMRGLSKQLGGTFQITQDNGVVIEVKFKTEEFTRAEY
ncbi:tetratricopeptide repeat-containing sensor histidine kinase [Mucilaginibacter flavus]|uniref:tetratricopeptide repeat-containing sensor histidine kinase n=1 Tax=Mucilaginibacter flavus TaxID=931504 RepID=UPI0025B45E0F|nr:histidine kinase dimerization/phosphoacceptor domain -containing protein [Mucilaginibacter flavus]MDN3581810.1 histidine kinase dimerization/phosphoacceptor domain -containing protein [Mucilaginibacter flavus]